ncbi:MAG: class I SAM-dependent methyltransferase [Candidatus Omnitrophica bacterium]|nr:class I SAM-dependent methyltransferase [Candidatus Omnitrophota bacterium]
MKKLRIISKSIFLKITGINDTVMPEYKSRIGIVKYLFYKRLATAIKLTDFKAGSNILDIGTDSGLLLKIIKRKRNPLLGINIASDHNLYGCDMNQSIMKIKLKKAHFLRCDINSISSRDNSFDTIYCLDTLEHIKNLQYPISEIKRVLRPRGQLIVSIPTENFIYRLGRFLIKGTFSSINGPASSPHYWNANHIRKALDNHFLRKKKIVLLNPVLDFFWIIKYVNIK